MADLVEDTMANYKLVPLPLCSVLQRKRLPFGMLQCVLIFRLNAHISFSTGETIGGLLNASFGYVSNYLLLPLPTPILTPPVTPSS
jgi:hypothetical protein